MSTALTAATPRSLPEVLRVLREWQHEGAVMQLHPGDLGWFWRFGVEAAAAAVRTWRRDGRIVAIGLLDGPGLIRLTTAPEARRDADLARRMAADLHDPGRGVLPAGPASMEAPVDALVREPIAELGWGPDEPWTPLRRDLAVPVPEPDLRVVVAGPRLVSERSALQRAAFTGSTFSDERWHAMAAGPAYADARCLIGYDDRDRAVATATVWSAGPGRPGVIEPLGAHRDHRGLGHGRAITLAAAAALRDLGASSALVCTESANAAGVAAYTSAGFTPLPTRVDRRRSA